MRCKAIILIKNRLLFGHSLALQKNAGIKGKISKRLTNTVMNNMHKREDIKDCISHLFDRYIIYHLHVGKKEQKKQSFT